MNTLSRLVANTHAQVAPLDWRNWTREVSFSAARTLSPARSGQPQTPAGAEAELEEKIQAAYGAGFAEGQATAQRVAEAKVRDAAGQLAAGIAELAEMRKNALRDAEADVVRLSIEVARRVLHREISLDKCALEGLVYAAIEKLRSETVHRVRVNPDQEQMIRASLQQLGRGSEIEVLSDAGMARGGMVFETERGSLDASVETQLREIDRGLADRLGDLS